MTLRAQLAAHGDIECTILHSAKFMQASIAYFAMFNCTKIITTAIIRRVLIDFIITSTHFRKS
jgi:hypothetical protein